MRNAPAFVSAILLALIFLDMPGSGYFLAGAAAIVFGPIVATRAVEAALWTLAAILDACRAPPAREIVRIAIVAGLATAAITAAVSAGYAEPADQPPFFVVVEAYIDGATALPDMSEADRAALRSVLHPIVEAARDGCK